MSDTCTTKVLYEDDKRYVVSLTNSSDGTGEYRIKKVTDNLRIKNIKYSLGTMKALMELESSNIPKNSVTMTYAASGSSGITVADNDNIDFGTGNFTIRWKGALPDWTPDSGNSFLIMKKPLGSGNPGYILYVNNTFGAIKVQLADSTWTASVVPTLTNGTVHEIVAVVTYGAVNTLVDFYVDGVALGTQQSVASVGTVSSAASLYVNGTSGTRTASLLSTVTLYNRALSAAEVLSLYQSGVATADQWGSQTAVYTSDFSVNVDGWNNVRTTIQGNIDGIGGQNDNLRIYASVDNATHIVYTISNKLTVGSYNLVTLDYYMPSGNTNVDGMGIYDASGSLPETIFTTKDAWTSISVVLPKTITDGRVTVYLYKGAAASFAGAGNVADDLLYLRNIKVYKLGATLDLEPSGIGATGWTDASLNGLNASYPAAGCTPNLLNNPYKPYILSDNGEINVDTDMSGKLITDIFLTTIGHASGATYNIILDCEKF